MKNQNELIRIFTDGACEPNPGAGAWAAIVQIDETVIEIGGNSPQTTSNRMELSAALKALEIVIMRKSHSITVFSDSKYLVDGMTSWIHGWKKNGWIRKTRQGSFPIKNEDLWRALDSHSEALSLKWVHVPGHRGIPGNERADEIAGELQSGQQVVLYEGSLAGYGIDLSDLKPRHAKPKREFAKRNVVVISNTEKSFDPLSFFSIESLQASQASF